MTVRTQVVQSCLSERKNANLSQVHSHVYGWCPIRFYEKNSMLQTICVETYGTPCIYICVYAYIFFFFFIANQIYKLQNEQE